MLPHNTDDVRIRELKGLTPPAHLIREFPCAEPVSDFIYHARQAMHRILHGMDDRLIVIIGPYSIHDPKATLDYARRLLEQHKRFASELEIVMRVYFEKTAHDGQLEKADQRSAHRQQLQDQRRPAHRARIADEHQRDGAARRHRVPQHDQPAVHRRSDFVGRNRRADDEIAGASRAGVGVVMSGRIQERHRRQREDRRRCDQGVVAAASFPVGDQRRPFGDRLDRGQRGLPHHPARQQDAELRRDQRRYGVQRYRQGGTGRASDDRREPRQQLEEAREPDSDLRRHRPATRGRRRTDRRRDGRVASRRRTAGPEGRVRADLRAERHRCVHRMGREREGARRDGGSGEAAAPWRGVREIESAKRGGHRDDRLTQVRSCFHSTSSPPSARFSTLASTNIRSDRRFT